MIDRLFLKKLTQEGKRNYWFIQIGIDIIYIAILFLGLNYDMDYLFGDGSGVLIIGVLASAIFSGLICLNFWKITDDKELNQ